MSYEVYRIKSVEKALHTLKLFINNRTEITLNELSQELGVHKSTGYRIAVTLCEEGFLRWDSYKGTYSLGLKILELSATLVHSLELRTRARPYLEKLNQDLDEFIHLGVLDGGDVVYIDKIDRNRSIRLYSEIGKRVPCYCTALGKALLAGLSDHEVKNLIKGKSFKRYTSNTIVTLPDLLDHLKEVRKKGYALDLEEHEPLIYCVAAPIRDYTGKYIAALSVTSIIKQFTEEMLDRYIKLTLEVADRISADMGYTVYQNQLSDLD